MLSISISGRYFRCANSLSSFQITLSENSIYTSNKIEDTGEKIGRKSHSLILKRVSVPYLAVPTRIV